MRYELTIPARINLLGNPGDANEGDFAVISAAVSPLAGARVEPARGLVLEYGPPPARRGLQRTALEDDAPQRQEFCPVCLPLPYDGRLDLLKAAANRLAAYSPELRQKLDSQGVRISVWSTVPRQSGLGGSSLLLLLALASLRAYYQLDPQRHNDYVLCELAQRAESLEMGIACGYADRYIPLFGGLAYIDYRDKLLQRPLQQEPYATIEPLQRYVRSLPLVAIATGVQHNSGDVHGRMRPRYLAEQAAWLAQGGEAPPLVALMQAAHRTAWRGKIALLEGDLQTFGDLMNENHQLVDRMMALCGFADGAGEANNLCIRAALENGALGAKLTGAGGGGSVYALARPGDETRLAQALRRVARQEGLHQALVYRPRLQRRGLVVQAYPDPA